MLRVKSNIIEQKNNKNWKKIWIIAIASSGVPFMQLSFILILKAAKQNL